jgi:hypothetical protein
MQMLTAAFKALVRISMRGTIRDEFLSRPMKNEAVLPTFEVQSCRLISHSVCIISFLEVAMDEDKMPSFVDPLPH